MSWNSCLTKLLCLLGIFLLRLPNINGKTDTAKKNVLLLLGNLLFYECACFHECVILILSNN